MVFLVSASRSLVILIVLGALDVPVTPAGAAQDSARPPALHSSVPSHVTPRARPEGAPPGTHAQRAPSRVPSPSTPARPESQPVRVVEPERASRADAARDKVNINTADVRTLMTLPGVTRKVAHAIVAYRDAHGPFRRPADLRTVDGVGERVWEKSRRRIVTR